MSKQQLTRRVSDAEERTSTLEREAAAGLCSRVAAIIMSGVCVLTIVFAAFFAAPLVFSFPTALAAMERRPGVPPVGM